MIGRGTRRPHILGLMAAGFLSASVMAQIGPHRHLPPASADSAGVAGPAAGSGLVLIAPPAPPTDHPSEPAGFHSPSAASGVLAGSGSAPARAAATAGSSTVPPPPTASTWGPAGSATTLVVYDTTNTYGWLGELYAIAGGNLASHFGTVTAEPVVDYVAGQVNGYTATMYFGSTYNEPVPTAFLNDVLASSRPVIWAGDNIWQLSGAGTADASFQASYGWDPSTSYFDPTDTVTQVRYDGQTLTRDGSAGPLLAPHITSPGLVTTLASAQCGTTSAPVACAGIAQAPSGATTFPWAIQSANLTYIGEIPLSYITESDRYLAFSDLLFPALAPAAPAVHQALVRLEDVSPGINTPAQLKADADYLSSAGVPFLVAVIPQYVDPNGYFTNGVPVSENISQKSNPTVAAFDNALTYMASKGGTIMEEGYTHQYSNVANPYSAVSGDDFEFYRAECAATQNQPYIFDATCPNTDWVIQEGALPSDSAAWAQSRAQTGQQLFTAAGFVTPTIWETPHYSATAADYRGFDQAFPVRSERVQFFGGQLSGNTANSGHLFGQFFPYVVHDVYGETVLPENLGNYGPSEVNNNPPKPVSYIVANAQAELAVRQGVASFFFHPYYDVSYLQQMVQGIQALGYSFVAPSQLLPPTPPPGVTAVSPTSGGASQATQVTITGVNLGGATAVSFGTNAATIVSDTLSQIVAIAPRLAPGTVDVRVTTAGGTSPVVAGDRFSSVGATSTRLVASKNPVAAGKPVMYNASVTTTGLVGGSPPGPTVVFSDNGNAIAGCPPQVLSPAGGASCTVTYSKAQQGAHLIVATYVGDASHVGSSGQLSERVN